MNFLVTGGTGLIGSHFIRSRPKDHFTVLTRNGRASINHSNIRFIHNLDQLQSLNEYDAVLNLAGEPLVGRRWGARGKQRIVESRVGTTQQLVELLYKSDKPPSLFLSGSAIGIYGSQGSTPCSEDQDLIPDSNDFPKTLCLDWEKSAESAGEQTRLVLLRTGIVLSEQGGALSKMLTPFKLGLGGVIGSGQQYMSWIHLDDMVNALTFLVDHSEIHGPVNLVAPNPVTNKEFSRCLAAILKRPAILPMPAFVLKVLFGEASQLLLDSQCVVPSVLINSGFKFSFTNLAPSLKDLCAKD